jgi:hypothetical protein
MKRFTAVLLLTFVSGSAFAQETDESGRQVKYKDRTELDFEAVDVTGELLKPQGQLMTERRKASFNPLITLRTEFNDEMKSSLAEIQ